MQKATLEGYREFCASEKSVINMVLSRAKQRGNAPALVGFIEDKKYTYTWKDLTKIVYAIAHFIISKDLQKGDRVAIFSQNCPEWTLADLGIQAAGCVPVPIYATNSKDEAKYILDDASIKAVFTGDEQYDKILQIVNETSVQVIVSFQDSVKINGNNSYYFNEIIKAEVNNDVKKTVDARINELSNNDMLTIIYTSGTTGNPKGAVHTHASFLAGIYVSVFRFPEAGPGMVSLAFLPLSHVFERMWTYGVLLKGVKTITAVIQKTLWKLYPYQNLIICAVFPVYGKRCMLPYLTNWKQHHLQKRNCLNGQLKQVVNMMPKKGQKNLLGHG